MPERRISPAPGFQNYTPVSLEFGTSGLRGLVKDITDREAYINVKGGSAAHAAVARVSL